MRNEGTRNRSSPSGSPWLHRQIGREEGEEFGQGLLVPGAPAGRVDENEVAVRELLDGRPVERTVKQANAQMLPYDSRHGVLRLGHLKVIHGFFAGMGAARRHSIAYGNCLFGHTHATDRCGTRARRATCCR